MMIIFGSVRDCLLANIQLSQTVCEFKPGMVCQRQCRRGEGGVALTCYLIIANTVSRKSWIDPLCVGVSVLVSVEGSSVSFSLWK